MFRNTQNLLNQARHLFFDGALIIELYTAIELGAMQSDVLKHSELVESSMPSFS